MARRKKIKVDFYDKKRRIAKVNANKYYIGNFIFVVLMLICIVLGGLYWQNTFVTGMIFILMGVFTFLEIGFTVYAEKHGWSSYEVFSYDYIEGSPIVYPKEKREKDLKDYKITVGIIMTVLFCFAIGVIVAGIYKLVR